MSSEKYFVLSSSEDGIRISEPLSAFELERWLGDSARDGEKVDFHDAVPDIDKGCWSDENKLLIIRGEIVVPQAVEKVVRYAVKR